MTSLDVLGSQPELLDCDGAEIDVAIDAMLKKATLEELGALLQAEENDEQAYLTITRHSVGRSFSAAAVLVAIGAGLAWFVSKAKNIDDGIKTIKKWAVQLTAWKARLELMGGHASFTVESLKFLCAADLYERFGIETNPCLALIRTQAEGTRSYDRTWVPFGPVYVFIPDMKKKVTHLYAIDFNGKILHRGEHPSFELEGLDEGQLETVTPLQLPTETVDPDIALWNEHMKDFNPEAATIEERTCEPSTYEPTKES